MVIFLLLPVLILSVCTVHMTIHVYVKFVEYVQSVLYKMSKRIEQIIHSWFLSNKEESAFLFISIV